MLKGLLSLTAAAAIIATPVAAHAFSLTNWDSTKHKFIILEEDDEWYVTIQPDQTLSHLCRSGCSIILGMDEDQDFQGNETVGILDGRLIVRNMRRNSRAATCPVEAWTPKYVAPWS